MTAEEWEACTNWEMMLHATRSQPRYTVRQARLLIAACCRVRIASLTLPAALEREEFLDIQERVADRSSETNWVAAVYEDEANGEQYEQVEGCHEAAEFYTLIVPHMGLHGALMYSTHRWPPETVSYDYSGVIQQQLLRCIFGNPFRPVAFAPEWRTSTAVGQAEAIYAGRAFDRLPVLADALDEAGCEHPAVLAHCRGPGPHARGCWVVDAVLGKS